MDIDGHRWIHVAPFWYILILKFDTATCESLETQWILGIPEIGHLEDLEGKVWAIHTCAWWRGMLWKNRIQQQRFSCGGGYENLEIPWNPIKSQLLRCNLMWIVFWWSSSVVLDYNFEWQMIPMTWDNPTNPSDSSGFRSQLSERATQSGIEGDHICHST